MTRRDLKMALLFPAHLVTVLGLFIAASSALAASENPTLLKAKQEAEAKGYVFATSRDEIVANAKKEGKLRVLGSLDAASLKVLTAAFRKKYPFIDARAEEVDLANGFSKTQHPHLLVNFHKPLHEVMQRALIAKAFAIGPF